jgi:transposase
MGETLFPGADDKVEGSARRVGAGAPRLVRPQRKQVLLQASDIDSLVDPEHRVRAVWAFVEALDVSALYARIAAVEGHVGRPPIDPKVLLALWVYATIEGVGSARELARLCEEHVAYRWICGGITPNHRLLADFRSDRGEEIDRLLTQSVGVLMARGLVRLEQVAQDGMRVRASAGAASFRSSDALKKCLAEAKEQVRRLKDEIDDDPGAGAKRSRASRERAAKEREAAVAEALRQWEEVAKGRKDQDETKARVSTTDPDCRVMRMADGGWRPAYNAQIACDVASQVIVGVAVSKSGSDYHQLPPMLEQVKRRARRKPAAWLVDGGFADLASVEHAAKKKVELFAPEMSGVHRTRRRGVPREDDSAAVAAWRARMATRRAKRVYVRRGASIECVNALARNRGLRALLVRGVEKARSVLALFALAHNVLRSLTLAPTA